MRGKKRLYEIVPARMFRAGGSFLTYDSPWELKRGQIVKVPLGKSETLGVVWQEVKKVDFATKTVTEVVDLPVLPEYMLESMVWMADYYIVALPLVVKMFLPKNVGRRSVRREKTEKKSVGGVKLETGDGEGKILLNEEQKEAKRKLKEIKTTTKLLFGVTGSGKTNVYLALAEEMIKAGRSVIVLVPEIALTSQLVEQFEAVFGEKVVVMHSRQTEATRRKIWQEGLWETTEGKSKIVIGARSALMVPLVNLGLIIVDEAHETAYFQEGLPRYSAVRLASAMIQFQERKRRKTEVGRETGLDIDKNTKVCYNGGLGYVGRDGVKPEQTERSGELECIEGGAMCVLGTATPLVQDYYLAKRHGAVVKMTKRAKKGAKRAKITVVDLRERGNLTKNRYFGDLLLKKMSETLKMGRQALIFHNRRGSAPLTLCEHCGWQAMCPTCFLPLTLHSDIFELVCHACGYRTKVPTVCLSCGQPDVLHKGFGTKMLEMELKKLFPGAKVARFDADNGREEALEKRYESVKNGEIEILVGTQTLARGLDLPKLALVGVVQADAGLNLPDFAAEERVFHLLTQVEGRVGRGHLAEAEVVVQTYQPENMVIRAVEEGDFEGFCENLLKQRQKGLLPPFRYLLKLEIVYKTEKVVVRKARELEAWARRWAKERRLKLEISMAMPDFHEQNSSGFFWYVLVRGARREDLVRMAREIPAGMKVRVAIDVPSLL